MWTDALRTHFVVVIFFVIIGSTMYSLRADVLFRVAGPTFLTVALSSPRACYKLSKLFAMNYTRARLKIGRFRFSARSYVIILHTCNLSDGPRSYRQTIASDRQKDRNDSNYDVLQNEVPGREENALSGFERCALARATIINKSLIRAAFAGSNAHSFCLITTNYRLSRLRGLQLLWISVW